MRLKSKLLNQNSEVAQKAHMICREWLTNIDSHLKENIGHITCNDIKETYFSLFEELKHWRSSSHGFTGFSEFLIFRSLYHTISEDFKETKKGQVETDPIIFRSKNYEIGQNIRMKIGGVNKFPDIYVMKNKKLFSIFQIKIVLNGGESQIINEIKTFELFKKFHPNIKGFFVVFIKENFNESKKQRLLNVGYQPVVLENNNELIFNVFKEAI